MTEPLKPLTTLITQLARSTKNGAAIPTRTAGAPAPTPATPQTLINKLTTRLSTLGTTDAKPRRKAFIEVALLLEWGEQLQLDPAYADLVTELTELISQHDAAVTALDGLLAQLSTTVDPKSSG